MKVIVRGWLVGCWLACCWQADAALGADQMPWCADFRTACGLAAEQHRLVLLHFTRDNCPPCRKVEAEVFSRQPVGEAVAQNFIPVRVHQAKNPDLVTRYQVKLFPTDVMVTPSGLEVYRAISPQTAADYIALVNQVAQQTGTSSPRQWASGLAQAAEQTAGGVAAKAQQSLTAAGDTAGQFAAGVQQQAVLGQQMAEEAANAGHEYRQQVVGAAEELHQQAADTAANAKDQLAATAQQFQQQSQEARQQWQQATQQTFDAARSAGQQAADTARTSGRSWQQSLNSLQSDMRSAFVPGGTSAAAKNPLAASPAANMPQQPQLPTENPWLTPAGRALASQQPANAPPSPASPPAAAPSVAPPLVDMPPAETAVASAAPPLTASPPTATPPAANPPSQASQRVASLPTIAASQAPPIALDGFCIVALVETKSWKKGDPKFGAIHRGRTYLFVSEDAQKTFLQNPDGFAPALSGCDPVRFAKTGELVEGKRAYGLITPDKRVFLFADEHSLKVFENSPGEFVEAARQAMLRAETGNLFR